MTLIVVGTASLTGSALAAPAIGDSNDIFDYLTTTHPIRDWIAHAKAEYTRFEHDQPVHHPRFTIEVDNNLKESIPFDVEKNQQYGTARPHLSPAYLITLTPDPCREKLALTTGRPALPDRISVHRYWSIETAINNKITP